MPTFNQLIKKGRVVRVKKLKTGALRDNFNTITNRFAKTINPVKKGVVTVVNHDPQKTSFGLEKNL